MASLPPGNAPAAADPPIGASEFAELLAGLGPWGSGGDRRVAVAVSGGADSLCLAMLAAGWGDPFAIIVDHGLRPESAAEAAWTARALQARAIPSRTMTLRDLHAGPALAARARAARYAALSAACREAGLVDLLLGHHAADQAETIVMRERAGSGPAGLAGMAAVVASASVRFVRPLLAIPPGRLRATLRQLGQDWVEDPSNADPRALRTMLRAELARVPPAAPAPPDRTRVDEATATELAVCATIHPEGHVVVASDRIGVQALRALLRTVSGGEFWPSGAAVAPLAARLRRATLAGVQVLPAGRLGPGWLLVREAAAMAAATDVAEGAAWDGRFRVTGISADGYSLGPLGADAVRFRRNSLLPAAILRTLPAIRRNNVLSAVPHLAYGNASIDLVRVRLHSAAAPVCAAAFVPI